MLSKDAKADVCWHHCCQQSQLVYAHSQNAFFAHVCKFTKSQGEAILLSVGDNVLSDSDAANVLLEELSFNFSFWYIAEYYSFYPQIATSTDLLLEYQKKLRKDSFYLQKSVASLIIQPNIVYQHSLLKELFSLY